MKSTLLIVIWLAIPMLAKSQSLAIDWIEVVGNKLVLHYNLEDPNPNHQYIVGLFCSRDNFISELTKVSGDRGTEVKPGKNKSITWDVTKEFPGYKGSLIFEIRGRVFVPFVKLSSISEGSVFKRGKHYPLTWTSGNLSGQVNIELYKGQERIPVENNVPNVGKYDWRVASNLKKGSDYYFKFTNAKDRNDYVQSNMFTIKPKVPLLFKALGVVVVGAGVIFLSGGSDSPTTSVVEEALPPNPGKPN